jgi:hypothetical protein
MHLLGWPAHVFDDCRICPPIHRKYLVSRPVRKLRLVERCIAVEQLACLADSRRYEGDCVQRSVHLEGVGGTCLGAGVGRATVLLEPQLHLKVDWCELYARRTLSLWTRGLAAWRIDHLWSSLSVAGAECVKCRRGDMRRLRMGSLLL